MSIYSTKNITRENAIEQIREERAKKIMLCDLTDTELEDLMFEYFGEKRFENYSIVEEEK